MFEVNAKWITSATECENAPLLRKEFNLDKAIKNASLLVCGLGYYEAWINGQRVGDHVLDPAQTDYEKRVFYVEYKVTELLAYGNNTMGIILGNGWYNQDRVWEQRKKASDPNMQGSDTPQITTGLSYGRPRLLLQLNIELNDGSIYKIFSDKNWSSISSPIVENNIYAGEVYDARLEIKDWAKSSLDNKNWKPVKLASEPGGELQLQSCPPIRKIEELKILKISATKTNKYTLDFGQNFSGWLKITLKAKRGTVISMRFAETIDSDGLIDTASTGVFATNVEQIDRYICSGEGEESWEPRFTYHGFRYVEVMGWPGDLQIEDITGIVVHTDLRKAGAFECSNNRLNRLHNMAIWTHRSNIHGLAEDCPVRERCGWLGDANLVAEYSMWNYEAKDFWKKVLDDIETSRIKNNGLPTNIAPGKRCEKSNANPDWAAAFIMLPYYTYLFYADKDVIIKHWNGMEKLMNHYKEQSENWIIKGGFGDFFDPGTDNIVMHTPQTLTTTFWYFRCASVMAKMARVTNKTQEQLDYSETALNIKKQVIQKFYDSDLGTFGSQAGDTLALEFGIHETDQENRLLESLIRDLERRNNHLNVGVMGVRYIFEVLSRYGYGDLALGVLEKNTYPSFGHLIERGATTLWECWGEAGHDQKHGPRSLSHPFMGGYDNWFYNTLAGIKPNDDKPGFEKFTIEPHPIRKIEKLNASYKSVFGEIKSNWEFENNQIKISGEVPAACTCTLILPFTKKRLELKAGSYCYKYETS